MSYSEVFSSDNKKVAPVSSAVVIKYSTKLNDTQLEELASALEYETVRVLGRDSRISSSDMANYLRTLYAMRVNYLQSKSLGEHSDGNYTYFVPTVFSTCLSKFGKTKDERKNLFFDIENSEEEYALSGIEMRKISAQLELGESAGLKVTKGLPRGKEGDVAVVAIQHLNNSLLSYRDDEYVSGFWASLINVEWLADKSEYVSDQRNSYGQVVNYASYIPKLVQQNS